MRISGLNKLASCVHILTRIHEICSTLQNCCHYVASGQTYINFEVTITVKLANDVVLHTHVENGKFMEK